MTKPRIKKITNLEGVNPLYIINFGEITIHYTSAFLVCEFCKKHCKTMHYYSSGDEREGFVCCSSKNRKECRNKGLDKAKTFFSRKKHYYACWIKYLKT